MTEDERRRRNVEKDMQSNDDLRRERAKSVVDLAEAARANAKKVGTNPVDDLLAFYGTAKGYDEKTKIADAMAYLRIDLELGSRGTGPEGGIGL